LNGVAKKTLSYMGLCFFGNSNRVGKKLRQFWFLVPTSTKPRQQQCF